jgi:ribosomal protein S18 acetylase RimI-like enzyme
MSDEAASPARLGAEPFQIRAATVADAPAIAALHREGLPEAFLSGLGPAFLQVLYRALATDPEAVAVVAERDGAVAGFVIGVPSVRRFYRRFFLRHAARAAAAAAPRVLRPGVVRRMRETASYPQGMSGLPEAELLSIVVGGTARRSGVATDLVTKLFADLAARGVPEVKVVVSAGNLPANRFYERVGFRLAGSTEVHEGDVSNVWVSRCRS